MGKDYIETIPRQVKDADLASDSIDHTAIADGFIKTDSGDPAKTNDLKNFFETISKGKREQEKLFSNISVKSPDLSSFFSAIKEGKKIQKEKLKKEKDKLKELESLLFSGVKRKRVIVKKVTSKVKPIKIKRKAINLMEPEPIKFTTKSENKKHLTTDVENLEAVQEELRKLAEGSSVKINEANLDTPEGLKDEFLKFKNSVHRQLSSIGGGGEVNLSNLDDVDTSARADGYALKYRASDGKYEFGESGSSSVDLSAVDQDMIPDGDGTRSIGSSSKRWKELFLSSETINLGGATISSDGTGTMTIASTGVTIPTGSKDADGNKLSVSNAAGRPVTTVDFFSRAGGYTTANKVFLFKGNVADQTIFTDFYVSDGTQITDTSDTLFAF